MGYQQVDHQKITKKIHELISWDKKNLQPLLGYLGVPGVQAGDLPRQGGRIGLQVGRIAAPGVQAIPGWEKSHGKPWELLEDSDDLPWFTMGKWWFNGI